MVSPSTIVSPTLTHSSRWNHHNSLSSPLRIRRASSLNFRINKSHNLKRHSLSQLGNGNKLDKTIEHGLTCQYNSTVSFVKSGIPRSSESIQFADQSNSDVAVGVWQETGDVQSCTASSTAEGVEDGWTSVSNDGKYATQIELDQPGVVDPSQLSEPQIAVSGTNVPSALPAVFDPSIQADTVPLSLNVPMGVERSGSHQFNRQFDEFQVCGSQYQSAGLTTPVADVQSSRTDTASLVEHMTIDLNQSVDCSKDANSKLTDDNLPNHQYTACCNENPSTETYILPVHSGCPSSRSILTTSRRVDIQTQTNPLDFDSLYRLKLKPRNMPKLKIKGVISNPAIKFVFTPCAVNYSLAKSNHSRSTIVKNSFRENEIGRDHASATKVSSGGDANSRTMKTTQSQTLIPHGSMELGKFSRSDAELNKKPRGKKKKLEAGEPVKPRNAFQSFLGDKIPEARKLYPSWSKSEVYKLVTAQWKDLDTGLKKEYQKLAKLEMEEYKRIYSIWVQNRQTEVNLESSAGGDFKSQGPPLQQPSLLKYLVRPEDTKARSKDRCPLPLASDGMSGFGGEEVEVEVEEEEILCVSGDECRVNVELGVEWGPGDDGREESEEEMLDV